MWYFQDIPIKSFLPTAEDNKIVRKYAILVVHGILRKYLQVYGNTKPVKPSHRFSQPSNGKSQTVGLWTLKRINYFIWFWIKYFKSP